MLSFFRRMIAHRFGGAIALGFVALLGLAFVLGDRSSLSGGESTAAKGDTVATVGKKTISVEDLQAAVQRDMDGYRQQQPTLTMAEFVAGGGFDATLERLIDSTALRQFAQAQGMVVGKPAVDAVIASQPGLSGLDGKFSQEKYETALRQIGMTDAQVRLQTSDQILVKQLWQSPLKANQVPLQLALPYSSLLLEKRAGTIGFVPSQALATGPAPTDAELNAYYARNVSRYRVPERRVIRYAIVNAASIAAEATPTDAEIAAAYKAQASKYAAADLRTIVQIVVADQTAANALAAKVRAGTPIDQAARAAGLEPATLTDTQKATYAAQSSPAIADAAFAGKVGDVVGPLRAPLGFVVLKVQTQRTRPATTLAAATPELKTSLATQKSAALLADRRNAFEDQLSKVSFDGIVAQQKLTAVRTPALLASGQDIENPTAKPDPAIAPIVTAAFAAHAGDTPQTVPLGPDGSFALSMLEKIVPSAPRPLAQIRDAVVRDFTIDRAQKAARKVAGTIVAVANAGTPLGQAFAATKLTLPPLRPIAGPRAELMANPRGVPAPLQMLFAMAEKTTKLLEAPNGAGYFIIHLDKITPGDASGNARVIAGTQADIASVIGREYVAQFGKAVQVAVGTKRNAAAIAKLKAQMVGGVSADDQQP
ncbi:SurA N-terminal domain-containing protein [Sphingomonas sp. RB3P16]|uniref:peptidylprolyl isomerase n=1 Tax=Parasphingomonas frigoris TaxID=3096163 RepID=UPI002FC77D6F